MAVRQDGFAKDGTAFPTETMTGTARKFTGIVFLDDIQTSDAFDFVVSFALGSGSRWSGWIGELTHGVVI